MRQIYLSAIALLVLSGCNNGEEKKPAESSGKSSQAIGCYNPNTTDKQWYLSGKKAPKFKGLDGIEFTVTTTSPEAQEYFNQGMMLAYGFNHAEAARSFFEAGRLDSSCAMAFWGFAFVLGPNYNGGMEEDNYQRAWEAVNKAKSLSINSTPKEKALIDALMVRYAEKPPADRSALDIAYAAAMKKVYAQFSTDADVGALYAEAIMDLHPWDLYDKASKAPKPWTPELISVLEHLMKQHPQHPGAHHYFVHAMEASATPEKALPSAKLLETLVQGSGHLLHMPSHIYINTGDYHAGSLSNINAVNVDSIYTTACHAQGAYPLSYYPHNYHFLAATATLEGHTALAWKAAKKLEQHTSEEIMRMPGWGTLQHYHIIPYYIAVKLSMWDTILAFAPPAKDLVYPRAIWHYAKGMAFLGKHNMPAAQKEMDSLAMLSSDTTLQQITIWNINTTGDLVQIAVKVLSAGIAMQQKEINKSITLLQQAVALEDKLNYNEPPDWFFSVRHYLGAVLLKAGKYIEAEKVYLRDLQTWKKNGWALIGLQQSLEKQNRHADAKKAKEAFEEAWKYADVNISSSSGFAE
ncbi:hypothetical protein HHL16_10905 [Pseudoflavitalea sp. G-6-1-2]|uniref:tetratricopeptide repeat protein n=1 Tax=Pseudoflavitalea sp. G-6-1-2 TaxID=2728841 RepID=UPI00146EB867|nr:hypothetical protein [Pseudoflavitalea sp. G-6-1-2]NML21386.1 hypothetical protein [Pseudoflavitalea sp. G-6-1-2]